ncbi:hypothetical protein AVEN_184183-1 [Araneus ventricosus]|uniref:Helitron helicase-like domain-containing protein n=1 Tax=Araneus ventricosus TaxID=182803 RepID=A0A4Y2VZY9_ARAVE|nr:hypothetical protein AVEN_184183-1 [Araneus ventricosus]
MPTLRIDSSQATEIRVNHPANEQCHIRILVQIESFFRQHNRLSDTYRMLREVESRVIAESNEEGEDVVVVYMVFRRDRHSDQRRYNASTANGIAMVFVNSYGEPPLERGIRVHPLNPENPQQPFININILIPNLDPMAYPILFPYGEPCWQPNWRSFTAVIDDFNQIIIAGKLRQQWIVDSYFQIEANNLNFIRTHQQQLRTELYQGLADHLENVAQNASVKAGISVLLPSSFEGSPRNMRVRCAEAMSIFAKYGALDLFITFTANPKWPEITENLRPSEQTTDHPDLLARVLNLKLKSLIDDLTVHGAVVKSIAHVYTIEFEKRVLPHTHILIVLRADYKFSTSERKDKFVFAEIPSSIENLRLHEIVTKCLMHAPCGIDNSGAPCMEADQCKKIFPKEFQTETAMNVSGYPLYRRRPGGTAFVRGREMANIFVVPYNPYLLKYNAHINVEAFTSLRAVKYIYNYIYKGFDCANMVLPAGQV